MPSLWDVCVKDKNVLKNAVPKTNAVECEKAIAAIKAALKDCETAGCCGLAANQLGINARVCVVKVDNEDYPTFEIDFCNPDIVEWKGSAMNQEWCFSVGPNDPYIVRRYTNITIKDDKHGLTPLKGIAAFAAQQEIDHLNGKLISDRGILAKVFMEKALKAQGQSSNSICSCGSGKIFKRCCGKKIIAAKNNAEYTKKRGAEKVSIRSNIKGDRKPI